MINEHLNELGKRLDSYFSNYDNILIIGGLILILLKIHA